MDKSVVETFYDGKAQYEWDRLARHRMEYAITLRALGEYLPAPPASILDIGGGPGRYAVALTQQGYAVTLFDLSELCLSFAKGKAQESGVEIAAYVHGNATKLSQFADQGFDVVLLMGPLYHLLDAGNRGRRSARRRGC